MLKYEIYQIYMTLITSTGIASIPLTKQSYLLIKVLTPLLLLLLLFPFSHDFCINLNSQFSPSFPHENSILNHF